MFGALGLTGCEEGKPRVYQEVAFKPLPAPMAGPMAGGPLGMPSMNTSPVDIQVTWTLPDTWMVKDSANGMRIGSFGIPDAGLANTGELDPNAVDVSVVQLAGNAGGLEANIARWMGQVGLKGALEDISLIIKAAPRFVTQTGQHGMFVDLTDKLSGDMTQSKSVFGAIIATENYTVFVKAMGQRSRVVTSKAQVKEFSKSIRIKGPQA